MRKSMKEERIGIEFETSEGYKCKVIEYQDCMKVQVMFLDKYQYTMWTRWSRLKGIKNPFHKSVFGVGYLGTDENGIPPTVSDGHGKPTREYTLWHGMLERCYSEKCHEKNPTYKNCTVCDRWKCYANFLEDISKIKGYELWRNNPKQKIALNKDKYYAELGIETDCKEYSLLTTRFITIKENVKEMIDRHNPPKKVRCVETQVIYDSTRDVERQTGLPQGNISRCCRGERKTCGGKHWEFVD